MFQRKGQLRGNLRCLQVLLFVVVVSGATIETPDDRNRIVGGSETTIDKFPYQLSIQLKTSKKIVHNCGAAIIDKKWAISAAHCTDGIPEEKLSLRAGSTNASEGGTVHQVKKIYTKDYSPDDYSNDICLLEVEPPFEYSESVKPVPLQKSAVADGTIGVATGWGRVKEDGKVSERLRQVSLAIYNTKKCKNQYTDKGYDYFLHDGQMCTLEAGKDTCQGDSGGPFVVDGKLTGVVSWGAGCARPNTPGVLTEVSYFGKWIKTVTGI